MPTSRSPIGIHAPSPDQRTWMIRDSSGSIPRNAVTVAGASPSSKGALNSTPPAVISSTSQTLTGERRGPAHSRGAGLDLWSDWRKLGAHPGSEPGCCGSAERLADQPFCLDRPCVPGNDWRTTVALPGSERDGTGQVRGSLSHVGRRIEVPRARSRTELERVGLQRDAVAEVVSRKRPS